MNYDGIVTALICFLCMGAFHPIVIKAEYYFSARCWPVFGVFGILALAASTVAGPVLLSASLGILGCCSLWSILELKEQEVRVRKGWFPRNPKREARISSRKSMIRR